MKYHPVSAANDIIIAMITDGEVTTLDIESFKEDAHYYAQDAADFATNGIANTMHVLDVWSRHPKAKCCDVYDTDNLYPPSMWEEARDAFAYSIAHSVLLGTAIYIVEKAVEKTNLYLTPYLHSMFQYPKETDYRLTVKFPFDGFKYDQKSTEGVYMYTNGQVDGHNAVAINCGPFWVSYEWEPTITTS